MGKRVKVAGNDSFRRGVGREGLCARQGQGRGSDGVGSMGRCRDGDGASRRDWRVLDHSHYKTKTFLGFLDK